MLNNQIDEPWRETAPFLRFELCEFEGRPQLLPWLFDLLVLCAFEHLGFISEVSCLNCVEKTFFLPVLKMSALGMQKTYSGATMRKIQSGNLVFAYCV